MYQVTFIDGTEFTGGEPEQSMWDMLPEKPIKSIVYWLTESEKWRFSDFEEYCHCVERVKGVNSAIERVTKAIIMARVKERVYQVIFDLKRGITFQLVTPYGKEYSPQERVDDAGRFLGYLNGKPVTGWRNGILDAEYPGPKLKRIE